MRGGNRSLSCVEETTSTDVPPPKEKRKDDHSYGFCWTGYANSPQPHLLVEVSLCAIVPRKLNYTHEQLLACVCLTKRIFVSGVVAHLQNKL